MRIGEVCDETRLSGPFLAPHLNLLDRHIFTSVFATCAAAVGLFAFVVALPNVVREVLGPLLAGQISLLGFGQLLWLLFLYATSYALPTGILTGVLLTLGRLSADSEITAMRAAGISVGRLSLPIYVLGALCAGAALYINLEASPRARFEFKNSLAAAVRADPVSLIVPKTFIRDFKGWVIYVGEKRGTELRDIWIQVLDDQRRVRRMVRAESGRVDFDESTNSLVVVSHRARTEERDEANPEDFSKSPHAPSVDRTEELRIPLDGYLSRSATRTKPEWLAQDELRAEQARLAARPAPPADKKLQYEREAMQLELIAQERFALALAVFSFALIGVPLGIKVSRRETSANLGLALGLVLTYYLLTGAIKGLDRRPELRPDLLLWAPNLLFIGLGLWLFNRVDRR